MAQKEAAMTMEQNPQHVPLLFVKSESSRVGSQETDAVLAY